MILRGDVPPLRPDLDTRLILAAVAEFQQCAPSVPKPGKGKRRV
jgi:hypothetical protein